MELLQIEAGTSSLGAGIAQLLPEALAELVGRGLARSAQVPVELEVQLPWRQVQVLLQEAVALLCVPGA